MPHSSVPYPLGIGGRPDLVWEAGDPAHPGAGRGIGPAAGEVEVWRLALPAAFGAPDAVRPEEAAHCRTFQAAADQRRAWWARALLRAVLGGRLGCPPAQVALLHSAGRTRHGPVCPQPGAPRVSLTHSGSWVLCAIAAGPVGIDCEAIPAAAEVGPGGDLAPILARLAGPVTAAWIAADPGPRFARWWTDREAWLKCHGGQLDDPHLIPADRALLRRGEPDPTSRCLRLDPGHIASLHAAAPITACRTAHWAPP